MVLDGELVGGCVWSGVVERWMNMQYRGRQELYVVSYDSIAG